MTLISRFTRLFRADLHAVLDRLEEPEALLRQSIREMEAALDGDARRCRALLHEQEHWTARQTELLQGLGAIESELDLCFAADKPELARSLVKRKLEVEQSAKLAAKKCALVAADLVELQARIEENRAQLDAVRQQAEALLDGPLASGETEGTSVKYSSLSEAEVEVAFLREQQKRGTL